MWFYKLVYRFYGWVVDFNNYALPKFEEYLFVLSHKWRQEQCLSYLNEDRCTKKKCICYEDE